MRGFAVVFLSTDEVEVTRRLQAEHGYALTLLCDPQRVAVSAWQLLNPHERGGVARPAVFLLDGTGVVRSRFLGGVSDRVGAARVLSAVDGP